MLATLYKTITDIILCRGKCNIILQYIVNKLFIDSINKYKINEKINENDIMFIWKGSMAMKSIYNKYKSCLAFTKNIFPNIFTYSDADYGIFINPNINNFNLHLAKCTRLAFIILVKIRSLININETSPSQLKDVLYINKSKYTITDESFYTNNYTDNPISLHEPVPVNINDFNKSFVLLRLQHSKMEEIEKKTKYEKIIKVSNNIHYEIIDIAIRTKDDDSLINDYNYMNNYNLLTAKVKDEVKDENEEQKNLFDCINYIVNKYTYNQDEFCFDYYTYSFDGYILDIINILFNSTDSGLPINKEVINIKHISRLFYFILLKLLEIKFKFEYKHEHKLVFNDYIDYLSKVFEDHTIECRVPVNLLIMPYFYSIQFFIFTYINNIKKNYNDEINKIVIYYMKNIIEMLKNDNVYNEFKKNHKRSVSNEVSLLNKYKKYKRKYLELKNLKN